MEYLNACNRFLPVLHCFAFPLSVSSFCWHFLAFHTPCCAQQDSFCCHLFLSLSLWFTTLSFLFSPSVCLYEQLDRSSFPHNITRHICCYVRPLIRLFCREGMYPSLFSAQGTLLFTFTVSHVFTVQLAYINFHNLTLCFHSRAFLRFSHSRTPTLASLHAHVL